MKIDRSAVYEKYNGHCAYCGKLIDIKNMQVDHLKPKKAWNEEDCGTDDFENLMPSCRRCNHYKRAHTLEVFRSLLLEMKRKITETYLGKVAVDYNMIEWRGWDGKFYFERKDNEI